MKNMIIKIIKYITKKQKLILHIKFNLLVKILYFINVKKDPNVKAELN